MKAQTVVPAGKIRSECWPVSASEHVGHTKRGHQSAIERAAVNNSNFILRSQCRQLPDNVLQFTPKLVKNELFIKGNAMAETAVPGHIQRLSQRPIAHLNPRV